MACRPTCVPACKAGMACDLKASPPVCILPNPNDFTLVIRTVERYQTGENEEALTAFGQSGELACCL